MPPRLTTAGERPSGRANSANSTVNGCSITATTRLPYRARRLRSGPAQGSYDGRPKADMILITDIHGDHLAPEIINQPTCGCVTGIPSESVRTQPSSFWMSWRLSEIAQARSSTFSVGFYSRPGDRRRHASVD